MEYIGTIDFDLVELPNWNAASAVEGYDISKLLSEILEYVRRYNDRAPVNQSAFGKNMAAEFVFKTSVGELVGLQSKEGISAVINADCNDTINNVPLQIKETINIYNALEYVNRLRGEMENTGKLTVQQIMDIHRVLMSGLRDDAGEIRKHRVYTYCKDEEVHFYPEPVIAEQILYACIDHHCIQMSRFAKLPADERFSIQNIEFIFKRAARLLFDFVDAHPFSDGNGRTCRLLANYVLSLITPFPVAPSCGDEKSMRDNYLKAIIECRDHRDKGPGALASMLILDTWRGWRSFSNYD